MYLAWPAIIIVAILIWYAGKNAGIEEAKEEYEDQLLVFQQQRSLVESYKQESEENLDEIFRLEDEMEKLQGQLKHKKH